MKTHLPDEVRGQESMTRVSLSALDDLSARMGVQDRSSGILKEEGFWPPFYWKFDSIRRFAGVQLGRDQLPVCSVYSQPLII